MPQKFLSIKNLEKYQTNTLKNPPWFKIHRVMFGDPEFIKLSPAYRFLYIGLIYLGVESGNRIYNDDQFLIQRLYIPASNVYGTCTDGILKVYKGHTKIDLTPLYRSGLLTTSNLSRSLSETEKSRDRERGEESRDSEASRVTNPKPGEPVDLRPNPFDEIWEAYPRKVGKQEARKAFTKLNGTGPETSVILAAILHQKSTTDWTKDGGQFIPHLSSWLNQARWADESPALPTTPAGSIYPEGFEIDDRGIALATSWGLNPHAELAAFRDHHTAKGTVFQCWHAAYRQWLRNAVKYTKRSGGTHAVS